jgi:hypothetical protein
MDHGKLSPASNFCLPHLRISESSIDGTAERLLEAIILIITFSFQYGARYEHLIII